MSQTDRDREIARAILAGKMSVDEAAKANRSGGAAAVSEPPPVPPGPPVIKPPTVSSVPSEDRKFPCKQCGARLDFDPSQRKLKCPYCGHEEKIDPANVRVEEYNYEEYLAKQVGEQGTIAGRSSEVRCPGCGANVLLEDKVVTDKCPFCATHLENLPVVQAKGQIMPEYILPFHITQRGSIEAFNKWISSRWFAPNNLKSMANLGQLSGVYIPFWTYDSMTYTHYTGMRGDDYWVTESYTDAEGKRQTRQVRKTRWTYVSGEVDHFFDDVLVCASKSVPRNYVDELEPWDLADLEGFRGDFLSGFKTERYAVDLGEGFGIARQMMDVTVRRLCEADIGGDHQRLDSVQTQHVGVTFKHVLLPIWLAVYRYQNKMFHFLVNARTGEVQGDRPYSWIKITLAVIAVAIVLALALWLYMQYQQR